MLLWLIRPFFKICVSVYRLCLTSTFMVLLSAVSLVTSPDSQESSNQVQTEKNLIHPQSLKTPMWICRIFCRDRECNVLCLIVSMSVMGSEKHWAEGGFHRCCDCCISTKPHGYQKSAARQSIQATGGVSSCFPYSILICSHWKNYHPFFLCIYYFFLSTVEIQLKYRLKAFN